MRHCRRARARQGCGPVRCFCGCSECLRAPPFDELLQRIGGIGGIECLGVTQAPEGATIQPELEVVYGRMTCPKCKRTLGQTRKLPISHAHLRDHIADVTSSLQTEAQKRGWTTMCGRCRDAE